MKNETEIAFEERIKRFNNYLLLLRKAQDKKDSDFLAKLGKLSLQELNILNIIGDNEPCIMRDIAQQSGLSLSSITVIVEKLVKAKLAIRLRNDEDRRIVYASLTPEGKRIYSIQIEHMQELLRKMLSGLSAKEQENLIFLFDKIVRNLT